MYFTVPHGVHAVRLGNDASVSQDITVEPGTLYSLTFSATRTCAQDEVLRVSVPPLAGDLPIQTLYSSTGGDTYAWGFIPTKTTVQVIFHNVGIEEDPACGPLFDAVFVTQLNQRDCLINLIFYAVEEISLLSLWPSSLRCLRDTTWLRMAASKKGLMSSKTPQPASSFLPSRKTAHLPSLAGSSNLKAVRFIDAEHHTVPFGQFAVELVAGRESVIAQVIRTISNRVYELSFVVGDAKNGCHGSMMVEAFAGNGTVKARFHSQGKGGHQAASLRFMALANRTRITFYAAYYHISVSNPGSLCGPVLDQVRVYPIKA
ncbi:unnamed protein product [Musa acuminata subsp. malaccensis]|uniref:(wild Malaysian banana) hypothetical protein n=1 Tax=Musa acuminata subsp. malaccensis TaxID=214687 RepID=A0A804JMG2_MUSAM|nr:unnamed protein product [Musa acuminata subsp. malaccensis]